MKVYPVVYVDWEEDVYVYKVFDSREKAQNYVDEVPPEEMKKVGQFYIKEWEVE